MNPIQPNSNTSHSAFAEYQLFKSEIALVRQNINLFQQGRISMADVSPDSGRVSARLKREVAHESWVVNQPTEAVVLAKERMMGDQLDLQEACLLEKLVKFSRAVGCIVLPDESKGTGWLIGEGLLLTNHHVLPNAAVAADSYVKMGYERSAEGKPQDGTTFRLRPDLFYLTPRETATADEEVELDFAVVAVEAQGLNGKPLADYGYVLLDGAGGKVIESENCMVIQHPQGGYKKITLRDIRLLLVTDRPDADKHIFYESDTQQGSSGGLVIGLGTGEAIALHRASVPRLDAQGRALRRDNQVWQPGDADSSIDWIANQGVRVSRIVNFIVQATVAPAMTVRHRQLATALSRTERQAEALMAANSGPKVPSGTAISTANSSVEGKVTGPQPSTSNVAAASITPLPEPQQLSGSAAAASKPAGTVDFLVRVTPISLLREYVVTTLQQQFPGSRVEELIAPDVPSPLRKYLVITVPDVSNPWKVAAQLEQVDGVEEAEPDLPRYLTASREDFRAEYPSPTSPKTWESSSGRTAWDEPRFLHLWQQGGHWLNGLNQQDPAGLREIRRWSQRAVNYDAQAVADLLGPAGLRALAGLRLAQFDTGYSDHSKVREGYNLNADYDAIDDDQDALDPLQRGLGDSPGHGTRTGSVLIGAAASQVPAAHEGNSGLLHELTTAGYTVQPRLVPFRVAKSVILLGSVKRVARAGQLALDHGFQVLTMSMGTLGNSVLDDLARTVYERGVIWTCAAGNQVNFVVAPGKYPGVICVAASNANDAPWSGSCRGAAVDISAPGEDVYVPILTEEGQEDMGYGSGTSYATPHVAAAAMLWLARNEQQIGQLYTQPWQRVEAFRWSVQRTARPAPAMPAGKYGAGILNIAALLALPLPAPAELRHAYSGASGLEMVEARRPLAVRELEYQDWQQVLKHPLEPVLPAESPVQPQELAPAGTVPLTPAAQRFARTLEAHAGLTSPAQGLEVAAGPAPGTAPAYQRLQALQAAQEQAKPRYANDPAVPTAEGIQPVTA